MKHILIILLGLTICILPTEIFSQTTISTSSGSNTIDLYNIQWSLGEMCGTNTNEVQNSIIITEGYLQPKYADLVKTLSNLDFEDILIYPNPVIDILYINLVLKEINFPLVVQLRNTLGELICTNEYLNYFYPAKIKFDLRKQIPGTYFLTFESNYGLRTFKIAKQ